MNVSDLEILEATRGVLAGVPGLRTAQMVRTGQSVEIPLSRLPAALIEPAGSENLTWPKTPVGQYRLVHWHATVLDRAVPGTRAFGSLVALAQACHDAVADDLLLGGKAEDGPPSVQEGSLAPAVGATRLGPIQLAAVQVGRPTSLRFGGASGYWPEPMVGAAALDDEMLFSSGPHVVVVGSPVRRVQDQTFNGLSGGLTVDLGDAPREIRQHGVLSAPSASGLAMLEAAIEAFIDGRSYTLTTPDGIDYPACRLERFERIGPPQVGAARHQSYEITYRQLVR